MQKLKKRLNDIDEDIKKKGEIEEKRNEIIKLKNKKKNINKNINDIKKVFN